MGWLIAAGVLVLLAILPVGLSALYDEGGPVARLIIGPVRIRLYPSRKGKKEEKPENKKEKKQKSKTAKKESAEKKNGGSFQDFIPLIQAALAFLDDFRRKLRVDRLEMKLIMAADDPCDLAVNYGKAWTALGNLMPQLERAFVIKKRDLQVECDFTADNTLILARMDLTITVGRLLYIAVFHGIVILRRYLNIMKLRKGGATK